MTFNLQYLIVKSRQCVSRESNPFSCKNWVRCKLVCWRNSLAFALDLSIAVRMMLMFPQQGQSHL